MIDLTLLAAGRRRPAARWARGHPDLEQFSRLAEAFRPGDHRDGGASSAAELTVATSERSVAVERERLLVVARQEALGLKEEAVREASRRRDELDQAERRLTDREAAVGERQDRLRNDERAVEQRRTDLVKKEAASATLQEELQRAHRDVQVRLERVAALTAEDAAREVRQQVEDEARTQAAALARDIKEKARREAEKDARRIISMATQRLAAEHTAETTVATVALPSDEMKGRIIGREGRNIRAFELATGVDVIIDDTPDTVAISCFDPIRREVARRALEALIADGRIHPGRVEELVTKMRAELDKQLVELGEQAAYDVGVHGLHPELIKLVGRMRYRIVVRTEPLRALQGSRLARRDDGGGAAPRRGARQARRPACMTSARC